ncbi:hypothetical protein BJV77DRAFT_996187 [Russula vinacea]|nr:hypothetical protein BJV77DRAFT_996187 [Russula vinacea]
MFRGHMKLVVILELSQLCLPHRVFLNRVGRPQNQVLGEKMKKCMSVHVRDGFFRTARMNSSDLPLGQRRPSMLLYPRILRGPGDDYCNDSRCLGLELKLGRLSRPGCYSSVVVRKC